MMLRTLAFIVTLALGILPAPFAAEAQQAGKIPRIGFLGAQSPEGPWPYAFREGLRELGYVEGQNIAIEWRWGRGDAKRFPDFAAELARLKVDVIVAGGNAVVAAAKRATRTIPIVMVNVSDPVGIGFVASLARPGGNITGLTTQSPELHGKRLQLLKEAVPNLSWVAVLWDSTEPGRRDQVRETEVAAPALGVQLQLLEVRSPGHLDSAFAAMTREGAGAVVVPGSAMLFAHRARIAELAASRLSTTCPAMQYVEAGCLMSYGASFSDLHRRAAYFVDRILKGAKPAELPVEQPTKFALVVNLKTAGALGVTIPSSVLIRADKVLE